MKMIILLFILLSVFASAQTNIASIDQLIVNDGQSSLEQGIMFVESGSTNENAAKIVSDTFFVLLPKMDTLTLSKAFILRSRFPNVALIHPEWDTIAYARSSSLRHEKYINAKRRALSEDIDMISIIDVAQYGYNISDAKQDKHRITDLKIIYTNAVARLGLDSVHLCYIMKEIGIESEIVANSLIKVLMQHNSRTEISKTKSMLNQEAFKMAVKIARQNNRPTVGVVIPEYQTFIESQRTGVNFITAAQTLGMTVPDQWVVKIEDAQEIIKDVLDGTVIKPTEKQLSAIEVFLGVDALNNFIQKYNNL